MRRKAVIEVGKYEAREAPTGGWRVFVGAALAQAPISVHETRAEAVAAAKEYDAADKRRAA